MPLAPDKNIAEQLRQLLLEQDDYNAWMQEIEVEIQNNIS